MNVCVYRDTHNTHTYIHEEERVWLYGVSIYVLYMVWFMYFLVGIIFFLYLEIFK